MRTCTSRPGKRAITTQADVASALSDFAAYGDDCSSKLNSTWQSIDNEAAAAAKLNAQVPQ